MSPEAQRIAIAEACGWMHRIATRETPIEYCGMRLPNHFSNDPIDAWWKDGDPEHTGVYCQPPRYLSDLNAMHEAEKVLTHSPAEWSQCDEYEKQLNALTGNMYVRRFPLLHATAAQRAEAFLRTIGKWDDTK